MMPHIYHNSGPIIFQEYVGRRVNCYKMEKYEGRPFRDVFINQYGRDNAHVRLS